MRPPLRGERLAKAVYGVLVAGVVGFALWSVRLSPGEVVTAIPDMWRIATRMSPLDFTTARSGIITGMTESLAVALLASFFGFVFALPAGLLAARNVTFNRIVFVVTRLFLVFVHGVPELILALIFIAGMGLGVIPGTFALTIGATGFFAKLIADAVEEVDPIPPGSGDRHRPQPAPGVDRVGDPPGRCRPSSAACCTCTMSTSGCR